MRWCCALVLTAACADVEVVRLDVPASAAPLRVLWVGEGAPTEAWVLGQGAPALPALPLDRPLTVHLAEYAHASAALPPGRYAVATDGAPAEVLEEVRALRVAEIDAEGGVRWSTPAAVPAGLSPLELAVVCPLDVPSAPRAVVRLPRRCAIPPSARGRVCYGVPAYAPSMSGATAETSTSALLYDEGLDVLTEADGEPWMYLMSSRMDLPVAVRSLPARMRLATFSEALPSTFELLPLFDADAMGFAQGLRTSGDGRELFMNASLPDGGMQRAFHAWRPELAAPWSAARSGYLEVPGVTDQGYYLENPVLMPDHRTLLARVRGVVGAQWLAVLRRRTTDPGDVDFVLTADAVSLNPDPLFGGVTSVSLTCDGRHLLYGLRVAGHVEPWVAAIRQLDPVVLGQPERVPLDAEPLPSNTTFGEAPDCSALYVSSGPPLIAPRVDCP